jgi:hypothetical protein
MAKLLYNNSFDDLVAFGEFHYGQSPSMKQSIQRYQLLGAPAIFLIALFLMTAVSQVLLLPFTLNVLIAFAYAALFAFTAPRRFRAATRKNIQKMHGEGSNRRFLATKELEIVTDGLIERTPYSHTKMAWGAIEKIESNGDYIFLYVGAASAYIIPAKRLDAMDVRRFMTALQASYQPDQVLQTALPITVPRPAIVPVATTDAPAETVAVASHSRPWYVGQ